jgi:hypothetical protein
MNSTTTQPNLLELAKQGNAQAIATLMNRQLQPKGITVKVSLSGDCLMVVAESIEPPEQLFLVDFIRKGMTNLKIEAIKRVVVRGQATGKTASAWREAFDIHSDNFKKTVQTSSSTSSQAPTPSTSKPKFALGVLNKALNIIQNRKAERIALVAGTFLVTSMVWAGMGTLNPASKQAKSETQTNPITQSSFSQINTHSLTGTLVINELIYGLEGQFCSGENGYDDIHSGRQILVKNNKGEILATGELGQGKGVKTDFSEKLEQTATEAGLGTPLMCQFPITIENVPQADFYTFEIGRRGGMTYTAKELQQKGWKIELRLG